MSLINQVLKDLEKRHAGREVHGLSDSLRALPEDPPRRTVLWAIVGVLALGLLIAAAAWWFLLRPRPSAAPQLAPPLAAPVPAPVSAPPAPLAAGPLAESGTAALAPTPPPVPTQAVFPAPAPPVAAASVQLARAQDAGAPVRPVPAPPAPDVKPASRASVEVAAKADLPAQTPPRAAARPQTPAPLVEAGPTDASPAAEPPSTIDKQPRPLDPRALADGEFRRGMKLLQEAHSAEAERAFRAALAADPKAEPARQALLGLLLENGRRDEAETLLREGLAANPRNSKFAMILARMQLDRGAQDEAIATLTSNLSNLQWDPEYLAMAGAVFTRAGRHRDAADMYQAALRMGPNNALWNLGLGVALKGDGRAREAAAAFQRARDIGTLSPDLKAFAEQQQLDLR
jgi:MSHA biogenesis protein MshN